MAEVICGCEVVKSLHGSGAGHAYLARRPGEKGGGRLLVKTLAHHEGWDAEQSRRAANDFLQAATAQQEAASVSDAWAPIHEVDPSQPAIVSDYFERSAEWLISRRVGMSSADLHRIADSVLSGLAAIETGCSRPHGNLKPSNVLISGKGRIAKSRVALCDPAPPRTLRPEAARALDLHSVGRMLFELITREDYNELDDYPVPPNRFDKAMEPRAARQWVSVCNELLARELTADAARLEEARRRVRKLKPPSKSLKLIGLAGAAAIVVVLGFMMVKAILPKGKVRPVDPPPEFIAKWHELCDEHAAWFEDFSYEFHGQWLENARQGLRPEEPKLAALLAQFPGDWTVLDGEKPGRITGGNQRAELLRGEVQVAYKTQDIDRRLDTAVNRVRAIREAVTNLEARRDAKALAEALPKGSRLAQTLATLARDLPAIAAAGASAGQGGAGSESGEGRGRAVKDLILQRRQVAEAKALWDASEAVAAEVRKRFPQAAEQDKLLLSLVDRVERDLGGATLDAVPDRRSALGVFVTGVTTFLKDEWSAGRIDLKSFYTDNAEFFAARSSPLTEAEFNAWRKRAEDYRFVAPGEQAAFDGDLKVAQDALARIAHGIDELVKEEVEAGKVEAYRKSLAALTGKLDAPKAAGKLNVKRFKALEPEVRTLRMELTKLENAVEGDGKKKRTEWLAAREKDAQRLTGPLKEEWDKWLPALRDAEGQPLQVTAPQWKKAIERIGNLQVALEEVQRLPAYAPTSGAAASSWSARLQGVGDARRAAARDKLLAQVRDAKGLVAADFPTRGVASVAKGLKDEYTAMGDFAKAADGLERLLGEWYGPDDAEVQKVYGQAKALADRVLAGDAALMNQWQGVAGRADPPAGAAVDVLALSANPATAPQALHHWLLSSAPVIGSDQDAEALVRESGALLSAINQHAPAARKDPLSQRVRQRCRAAWMDAFVKAADEPAVRRLASRTSELHADLNDLKKPEHQRLLYNLWVYNLKRAPKDQVDALGKSMESFAPQDAELNKELERVRKILSQKVDAAAVRKVGPMSKPYARMTWQDATPAAADGEPPKEIVLTWNAHQLRFARVTPQTRPGEPEARAFYLSTTEMPVKLFADAAAVLAAEKVPTIGQNDVVTDQTKLGFRHWQLGFTGLALRNNWTIDSKTAGATGLVSEEQYWKDSARGGPPQPGHPMNYVTPTAAQAFAAGIGCRLPTVREWQEAYRFEAQALAARKPNLRDRSWSLHSDRIRELGKGDLRDMRVGTMDSHRMDVDDANRLIWRRDLAAATATAAEAYDDGYTWLAEVEPAGQQGVIHHLVGNVAEIVADHQARKFQLIGGSALSMPPTDRQLAEYQAKGLDATARLLQPIDLPTRPVLAYSDVGFRLAFDSPAATLAEARYVFAKAP